MHLGHFLASIILFLPAFAQAAAWTLDAGNFHSFKEFSFYTTDYYYDVKGQRYPQTRYSKVEVGHLMEVGLSDSLTLGGGYRIASVHGTAYLGSVTIPRNPLLSVGRPGRRDYYATGWNYGISDISLHARQRLHQTEQAVFSGQISYTLPSYFSSQLLPRSGAHNSALELRLLAGTNWALPNDDSPIHYANAELAYEKRFGETSDFLHADVTLGFQLSRSLTLMPQIFSTWRMARGRAYFTQSPDDDYDLVKGQISLVYSLWSHFSIQLGIFHHLHARNTGGGTGTLLSLWWTP